MVSTESWRWRKHRFLAIAFGTLVGYADIICFMQHGAFAATMTGNTILMVRAAFSTHGLEHSLQAAQSVWAYLVTMLCFMLGAFAYYAVEHIKPTRGASYLCPFLALIVIVVDFMGEHTGISRYSMYPLSSVFGALNAMATTGNCGSITAITGHYVKVMKALVTLITKGYSKNLLWQTLVSLAVILGLISGCVLGCIVALKVERRPTTPLLWPVAPILAILMCLHDHCLNRHKLLKGWGKRGDNKAEDVDEDSLWDYVDEEPGVQRDIENQNSSMSSQGPATSAQPSSVQT